MIDDEFFPPPECPVFEPNEEEFADPLGYINKIRPIAEKAGICKIRPPPHWQPPFAIDVENFKFTPRVQRINELGIHTRIRLQFIQSVARFWELQGHSFKLPHVGGKALDLYGLHEIVKSLGGFQETCKNKQWNIVCFKLHLQKNFSTVARQHYERILYPFDIMKSGILIEALESTEKRDSVASDLKLSQLKSKKKTMYKGSNVSLENLDLFQASQAMNSSPMKQRSKRRPLEDPLVVDVSKNKELAKLQLYGAGPKMVGLGVTADKTSIKSDGAQHDEKNSSLNNTEVVPQDIKVEVKSETSETIEIKPEIKPRIQMRTRGTDHIPYSIIDSIDNCKLCGKDSNDSLLLLCDGCDDSYHTYCLIPPLPNVPAGDWRCPKCITKECSKKTQAYGFEQARKEYSLQSFGEMADAFKSEYFNKPVHMVPTEVVEQEFWRLVGSLEEDLAVEYGADIHVIDNGSGFPRLCDKETRDLTPEEEEYAVSSWNLNNLPVDEQSLLKSISGDISGMKIPWVYVGMCFSAFCWHIEDHWTYSINYMHWGEPKTWYGVPREDADKLENVMQDSAPELFKNHPDLLHHLVTTMNPATLMKHGVRVVRTNQCAGEFMITFPRAYHAGFNQGYNFAEAVNFCPADWVPIGRECVAHYRLMKKCCVFSHEEIICKVANNPDRLDVQVAAVIYKDMLTMLQEERELRKNLLDLGIDKAEREAFELVPDDERQCLYCHTTCFLSAMTCPCSPDKLVCLRHVKNLCNNCEAAKFVLRYRYSLDELPPILHKLKSRAEAFDTWSEKVTNAFTKTNDKLSLQEIKVLLKEAEKGKFPENGLLQRIKSVVHEANVCSRVAQQLVNTRKHRTRIKDTGNIPKPNKCTLTLEEIQAFCKQIRNLPCIIQCVDEVSEYTKRIEEFIRIADEGLKKEEPSSGEILQLLEDSTEFDLDLPQIPRLHQALKQAKWLEEVRQRLFLDAKSSDVTYKSGVTLEQLRRLIDSGVSVAPIRSVERAMAELQELLTLAEGWEEKANMCLNTKPSVTLTTAVLVTEKACQIPVCLPQCVRLGEVAKKAKSWLSKIEKVQTQDYYPYVEVLEALLIQANSICIKLDQLTLIESQVASAKVWKERTSKTFLKKNGLFTLLQVLNPRNEFNPSTSLKWRRKRLRDAAIEEQNILENNAKCDNININNPPDPVKVVAAFKNAEKHEIELIQKIRKDNDGKVSGISSHYSPSAATNKQIEKHDSVDDSVVYCICRKPSSGLMLQCEVCHDWFHTTCVPLPKLSSNKSKVEQVFELKFLCPLCHRTRRPHLSTILSLLLQLQKLPVRIQEGEALQCLTERAMSWQDRARKILSSKEHQNYFENAFKLAGYSNLSNLSSQNCEENLKSDENNLFCTIKADRPTDEDDSTMIGVRSEGRNSIDEAIDAVIQHSVKQVEEQARLSTPGNVDSLISAANQAELYSRRFSDNSETNSMEHDDLEAAETLAMIASHPSDKMSHSASTGMTPSLFDISRTINNTNHVHESDSTTNIDNLSSTTCTTVNITSDITTSQHVNSTCVESDDELSYNTNTSERPSKASSDEPTHKVATNLSGPDIKVDGEINLKTSAKVECLPSHLKDLLEGLMLEGDLLEVTLPETQIIWKILQADQPNKDENLLALLEEEKKGMLAENERKRKKQDQAIERKKKQRIHGSDEKERKYKIERKRRRSEVKQAIATLTSGNDDDEYAFCSVEIGTGGRYRCLQPVGDEVNWVQCDGGCEEWFHCVCVKITASEARESEYVCEACRKSEVPNSSSLDIEEVKLSQETSTLSNSTPVHT